MYLAEDKEAKLGMTEPTNPQSFRVRKQYILDLLDNIQKIVEEESGITKEITTEVNNLNQYVRFGTLTLRYDGRGNLVEKGGKKFSYDWANRLISVEEGTNRVTFKYDALGRRIEKTSSQGATRYYYDGWDVIEERDGTDRVKAQYVYSGLDQPVELTKYTNEGTKTYYFHQNSIGSISFITDETGNIVEKVEYQPYGKPRFLIPTGNPENPYQEQSQSSIGNNYLFQGREYDYETSLYNFRMRYYDPEMGRFISREPEGYADSANLYQSFNQNPVNFKDPYGTQFRAGDSPYLTKKQEEEALKKIALSKEEKKRIEEADKGCMEEWVKCMEKNLGIPGFPFTGSPSEFLIAIGEAVKVGGEQVAYEVSRKRAIENLEKAINKLPKKQPPYQFWRFKEYKTITKISKVGGKVFIYAGIAAPIIGCYVDLLDCYFSIIPPESFHEKVLNLLIER